MFVTVYQEIETLHREAGFLGEGAELRVGDKLLRKACSMIDRVNCCERTHVQLGWRWEPA